MRADGAGRAFALYTQRGVVVKVMSGAAVANGAPLEADAAAGIILTHGLGVKPAKLLEPIP